MRNLERNQIPPNLFGSYAPHSFGGVRLPGWAIHLCHINTRSVITTHKKDNLWLGWMYAPLTQSPIKTVDFQSEESNILITRVWSEKALSLFSNSFISNSKSSQIFNFLKIKHKLLLKSNQFVSKTLLARRPTKSSLGVQTK